MPDYKKMEWMEIKLITNDKFYLPRETFMGNYANFVGQHISRLGAYNQAYEVVENHGDKIKVKKVADNTLYINFNQTVIARKVDKIVEVIE